MPGDPSHYAQLLLALVPGDVRKAISEAELLDRVAESQRLSKRAADTALTPAQRREAAEKARQVMRAAPRAVIEKQVAVKITKAQQLGNSPAADLLRRQAQDLLDQNPLAPRRGTAVRKAKGDEDPVAVFDADGNLLGIVDPGDVTPVASPGAGNAAQPADAAAAAQDPALDGQVVKALGGRIIVRDQYGRRLVTDRRSIRTASSKVIRKALDDGLVTLFDAAGRPHQVSRSAIQSPEAQARNTGPVNAGGTTGMGAPRRTGPAAALPGDGPQAARPGDVPGRQVIKSTGWSDVHSYTGQLVGVVKQADVITGSQGYLDRALAQGRAHSHANVYNAARRRTGIAPVSSILPVRPGR